MRLGEILNRTFQIYRAKFFVLTGVAALPALAWMVASTTKRALAMNSPTTGKNLLFHMTLPGLLSTTATYFVAGFLSYLAHPAFVRVAVNVIAGRPSSFQSSTKVIRLRVREFLALDMALLTAKLLLPAVIFVGCAVWLGRVIDSNAGGTSAVGAKLLFILISGSTFACAVWLGLSLSLSFPASVLENLPWFNSLKRSWVLSAGSRVRIALTWLSILSVASGLMMLVIFPSFLVIFALHLRGFAWHGYPLYRLLISLEIAIVSALIGPLYPIALTLFYYDQRIRHEGYDIERMMDAAGLNAPRTSPSAEGPTPAAEAVEDKA
jgi:hypothetical protein